MESALKKEVKELKSTTGELFREVFERLDDLEEQLDPKLPAGRKKIGLRT